MNFQSSQTLIDLFLIMQIPNFNQLFDDAALKIFADFEQATHFPHFLSQLLPLKYKISKGVVVNTKKEVSEENLILYDALNCPKLTSNGRHIIPANYVFSSITIADQLNHKTIERVLRKNREFFKVLNTQFPDNQLNKKPLNVWFFNDLETFLTLDDLEDRLLVEENPPDLVAVLNRGLLVTLNKHTIEQIFSLEQKKEAQSFDKTITANLVAITEKAVTTKYFKMGANAPYKNLFYFYIILLNLLKKQSFIEDGLSPEMVAIW